MATEIELKVHLDDSSPAKERLSALGVYCRSYTKTDTYWAYGPEAAAPIFASARGLPPSGLRVRRDSGVGWDGSAAESVLVTFKTKESAGGIEVNDEREFAVSGAAEVFEELLERLGLRRQIQKEKRGWAWTVAPENPAAPPILAELSNVSGLGWYLELEILAPGGIAPNGQTVAESRGRLLALLEKLEISPQRIESRPYTEMLRQNARC